MWAGSNGFRFQDTRTKMQQLAHTGHDNSHSAFASPLHALMQSGDDWIPTTGASGGRVAYGCSCTYVPSCSSRSLCMRVCPNKTLPGFSKCPHVVASSRCPSVSLPYPMSRCSSHYDTIRASQESATTLNAFLVEFNEYRKRLFLHI